MPTDPIEQDRTLAAFTDALMAGEAWQGDERPPLAELVELLARTMGPQPAPAALRRQVKRTIAAEWPRPHPSLREQVRALFRPPAGRWVWGSVGALALLALAVAFWLPADGGTISGTVSGEGGTLLLMIGLVLAGVVGLAWWAGRRKR